MSTNISTINKKKPGTKAPSKKEIIIAILIIAIAFFGTFGFFAILKLALNTTIPMVVVTSGSMEPTIYRGDLLLVQGKDAEEIKNGTISDLQGDIIIYDSEGLWSYSVGEPIVHRVVNKWYDEIEGKYYFYTKGDNNPDIDPPGESASLAVSEDRILGVVIAIIPKVGWIKLWLTESGLGVPLIVILGVALVGSIIWDLTHPEDKEKDTKKKDLNQLHSENTTNNTLNPADNLQSTDSKMDLGL
jgi:signal peptidase